MSRYGRWRIGISLVFVVLALGRCVDRAKAQETTTTEETTTTAAPTTTTAAPTTTTAAPTTTTTVPDDHPERAAVSFAWFAVVVVFALGLIAGLLTTG